MPKVTDKYGGKKCIKTLDKRTFSYKVCCHCWYGDSYPRKAKYVNQITKVKCKSKEGCIHRSKKIYNNQYQEQ